MSLSRASFFETLSFPFWCFKDLMWNRITLAFNPSPSRHAEQKSLPPETVSSSSGNSRTRCYGVTDFGSVAVFAARLCFFWPTGGLTFKLRFLANSDGTGARRRLRIVTGDVSLALDAAILSAMTGIDCSTSTTWLRHVLL